VVVELSTNGNFSSIHYQGTYNSKPGIPFSKSLIHIKA
jgi:hypothetical protein